MLGKGRHFPIFCGADQGWWIPSRPWWVKCFSLAQVQAAATEWMWFRNHERPHRALGGVIPK